MTWRWSRTYKTRWTWRLSCRIAAYYSRSVSGTCISARTANSLRKSTSSRIRRICRTDKVVSLTTLLITWRNEPKKSKKSSRLRRSSMSKMTKRTTSLRTLFNSSTNSPWVSRWCYTRYLMTVNTTSLKTRKSKSLQSLPWTPCISTMPSNLNIFTMSHGKLPRP